MKVLLTKARQTCKHTQLVCQDCGSLAFKEKPGRKGTKTYERMAKRIQKLMGQEEKDVSK